MSKNLNKILTSVNINPVLVDIGCSDTRFKTWDCIAGESVMVGFDPDTRDVPSSYQRRYKKIVMIDKAVCDNDADEQVEFVLTDYPFCSSTLEPDLTALEEYIIHDYFIPVSRKKVASTSINRLENEYAIKNIDWLKIDAQGADLKILKSIKTEILDHIIAIDVEPGFIDAYQGEDHFPEVHKFLTSKGFWLANLECQSYPRVRHDAIDKLSSLLGRKINAGSIKGSPTAAEARYLRTISGAVQSGERDLVLLFVFALVCGFTGFGFDVSQKYAEKFNKRPIIDLMNDNLKSTFKREYLYGYFKQGVLRTFLSRNPTVKKILRRMAKTCGTG